MLRDATASLLRLSMAMSDASVEGSMNERLAEHSPECSEVLASAMKNGTFRVTMLWLGLATTMTDLLGGCVAVW